VTAIFQLLISTYHHMYISVPKVLYILKYYKIWVWCREYLINLPSATSQAFFSCEWCAFLISLSLKIFSRARERNIFLGFKFLFLLPKSCKVSPCYIKFQYFDTCWPSGDMSATILESRDFCQTFCFEILFLPSKMYFKSK